MRRRLLLERVESLIAHRVRCLFRRLDVAVKEEGQTFTGGI